MAPSFKKALDILSKEERVKWKSFKKPFKCPNCGIENPSLDWCADAYYGNYSIDEFENLTLDSFVDCRECGKEVKLKFKLVAIAGE